MDTISEMADINLLMQQKKLKYCVIFIFILFSGKSYDVTYIRLNFQSPWPESFAIYKKTYENSSWVPYQFYSGSCLSTYGKQPFRPISRTSDTEAYCTDEYSDLSPLPGGSIPFSTLENRPSAMNFKNSPVLQVKKIMTL